MSAANAVDSSVWIGLLPCLGLVYLAGYFIYCGYKNEKTNGQKTRAANTRSIIMRDVAKDDTIFCFPLVDDFRVIKPSSTTRDDHPKEDED